MRTITVLSLIGLVSLSLAGCQSAPKLAGTSLGTEQAPDFHLRDANGQAVSLSQYRGKVVVLTFLYTQCTDYCPLTAELLRHADEAAGHPKNVVYLAVSVDPIGDTPANIATFNGEHHMDELGDRWRYLIGTPAELSSVWKSYYIGVSPELGPGESGHTSAMYFIDPRGNRRVMTEVDVGAEAIAQNELVLAKG